MTTATASVAPTDTLTSGAAMTDDLTFASAGAAGVHYARCWPCMTGCHYPTPTWHSWADLEDIVHAAWIGQPDPSDKRCACPCVDSRDFCDANAEPEPEIELGPLDLTPCVVCGETGACGYDAEGRVLIHLNPADDEELG